MKEIRDDTAQRIVSAAGAVFAERGYRGTTIRQITMRAGVNVAAVNYYFKNKLELYTRVLREAKRSAGQIAVQEIPGPPEQQLRGFIERFVHHLLDPERPAWHGRVIAMEMSNPTAALGVIVREITGPLFRDVRELVDKVVWNSASEAELDLLTLSIFGQCVFYACGRAVVEQLGTHLGQTANRTERIAKHVYSFSMAGLKEFRRNAAAAKTRATRPRQLTLS